MIAAGLGGRGAHQHRGRSAFYDHELQTAQARLLALGGVYDVRSRFSAINGGRLHYLDVGSGDVVLLIHGAGGGAANWYRLIGPLARDWRVIVPDLPGFGFSDSIDPVSPLGHQTARLLADWLQSIGVVRAHVVGTSFGGLTALRLAQHFAVQKIVAVDSVGIARGMSALLRLATLPLIARMVVAPTRGGSRRMLRHVLTSSRLPENHENALVDYLYASARRGNARRMARAFVRFASLRGQREFLSQIELQQLRERLLVVWGERDDFLPMPDVKRAAALAGCADVRIIPGAGHSPNWEQPDALLAIIEEHLRT